LRRVSSALGLLALTVLLVQCKGSFNPTAQTYRCGTLFDCLPGFACEAYPTIDGLNICVASADDSKDATIEDTAFSDATTDEPTDSDVEALLTDGSSVSVSCTSDDDCTSILAACKESVCDAEGTCSASVIAEDGTDCDDDDPCTESDECSVGECVGTPLEVEAVCVDDDPCTINTRCDVDGECAGEPKCTSSLSCVEVICEQGECGTKEEEGFCLIGGQCYKNGEDDPEDPCKRCNPEKDKLAFTVKEDGLACDDGNDCSEFGACIDGVCTDVDHMDDGTFCMSDEEPCRTGECEAGTCTLVAPLEDGFACDDGVLCTNQDQCVNGVCTGEQIFCEQNPELPCILSTCGTEGCEVDVADGFCFCEGMCVEENTLNPSNPCQRCNTDEQTTAWSPVPDGTPCGVGVCSGMCKQGKCNQTMAAQCVADGMCFDVWQKYPKYPCHHCVLSGKGAEWAAVAPGKACEASVPTEGPGYCVSTPKGVPQDCVWSPEVEVPSDGGWMGCSGCAGYEDQSPVHHVQLKPFLMDATEVPAELFIACLNTKNCAYDLLANEDLAAPGSQCSITPVMQGNTPGWKAKAPYLPINCVTRKEAATFCSWQGKALCSEAQWERVAVGGCLDLGFGTGASCTTLPANYTPPVYPWAPPVEWGDAQGPDCASANTQICKSGGPEPVLGEAGSGVKWASAKYYPVYGLAGNVAEWVGDAYHPTYEGAPDDGSFWTAEGQEADKGKGLGVTRGGSYMDTYPATTTTFRGQVVGDKRLPSVGFRCCRNAP
jgi:formylglycine-generating enzyme required for sulfatase activity